MHTIELSLQHIFYLIKIHLLYFMLTKGREKYLLKSQRLEESQMG